MVRLRHRYLLTEYSLSHVHVLNKETTPDVAQFRSNSIMESLNNAIRHLHGVQGVALTRAGLMVKYINNSTTIILIRMRRSAYEVVSSALPFVKQVDGRSISLRTIYTGATIKQCNQFIIKYQRRRLEEKYGSLKSDLQKKLFEQELANVKPMSVQIGSQPSQ